MNLPNASEMRERLNGGAHAKAQAQLDLIAKAIIESVENGRGDVSIDRGLEIGVKDALESKGYIVKEWHHYNDSGTTISW